MKTVDARSGIANELHRQARKNFPRRFVELKGINDLYQADLVDMTSFSKQNNGYKYILTVINCFTKFGIAIPLKTKTGIEVTKALEPILQRYSMKHFQTDQGTEFFNASVSSLLRKYNVNHYHTFSEKKASIVERFNRTIKSHMWKVFSTQGSYRWIDFIEKLISKYNNTVHRTIGIKPLEVTNQNEIDILSRITENRKKYSSKIKSKFEVGDRVRISRKQTDFSKGYWPRWSNEIFTIWKVQATNPTTYILKDDKGEIIKGGFYKEELSKSRYSDIYLVEKVLRKKGNKVLVRWLGFDQSHDSWVDKKKLIS
jgi:hypothetical protein